MKYKHIPVLLKEVMENACLKKGDFVIDCTLGGASYTLELAKKVGEKGKVFSFDLDKRAIKNAQVKIKEEKLNNIELINAGFNEIDNRIKEKEFALVVMDLGISSAQIDDLGRGMSFRSDAVLDMTFEGLGEEDNETIEIVNYAKEKELIRILKEYGEERFARSITKSIIRVRREKKITKISELLEAVRGGVPTSYLHKSKIHFATKTFQAIRIASNHEIERLESALPQALNKLKEKGRLIVVSFHSLEDRVVKNFFKDESRDCICPPEIPVCRCNHKARLKVVNKKPLEAGKEELLKNPRARSAKLRVAEKL
ncbi:16S rRNA (cytosine(1402)-N(4))-methyltransferase [Candidatus Parcubacteria bacterium]|nr:MAG: 16S rRNA (cytosine(1402)-N(4))-methyltransferase [Candidatus Parcubacteria bacterium]